MKTKHYNGISIPTLLLIFAIAPVAILFGSGCDIDDVPGQGGISRNDIKRMVQEREQRDAAIRQRGEQIQIERRAREWANRHP